MTRILLLLVLALSACANNQPPSCSGPIGVMNLGLWNPTAADMKAP